MEEGRYGRNDMMAYLVMMTARLLELHRVLKDTGSLYLHCDPTASHYLKVIMDTLFGPTNFHNEIVWRRTGTHGKARRYGPIHDTLLFYTKTNQYTWTYPKRPFMKGHAEEYFVEDSKGWRTNYYGNVLTGSGIRRGEFGEPWMGFDPTAKRRHWAIPGALIEDVGQEISNLSQHQKLDLLYELGRIKVVPGQAWPIYERYLDPSDGQAVSDLWAYQPYTDGTVFGKDKGVDEDVRWMTPRDQERLGYQAQKPMGLLERIIQASSKEGDVVLDPFCGCGTAMLAAHKLGRRWVGIDVTNLAIIVMKKRLEDAFPGIAYRIVGEPATHSEARDLSEQEPDGWWQFQWWALGLVGALPASDGRKKGADAGIDGFFSVHHDPKSYRQVIVQVKSGHVGAPLIRDLRGVIGEEKLGLFMNLDPPTEPMKSAASQAGLYHNPLMDHQYPKVQILTIEELLTGKQPHLPPRVQGAGGPRIWLRAAQWVLGV